MAASDRRFLELADFLMSFIDELNELAQAGSAVLVEGERDRTAIQRLGYTGRVLTKVSLHQPRMRSSLRGVTSVVILTDLDSEGRRLAGRYAELLARCGLRVSLTQRRRLAQVSHGVFPQVENLSRFAEVPEMRRLPKDEGLNTG